MGIILSFVGVMIMAVLASSWVVTQSQEEMKDMTEEEKKRYIEIISNMYPW